MNIKSLLQFKYVTLLLSASLFSLLFILKVPSLVLQSMAEKVKHTRAIGRRRREEKEEISHNKFFFLTSFALFYFIICYLLYKNTISKRVWIYKSLDWNKFEDEIYKHYKLNNFDDLSYFAALWLNRPVSILLCLCQTGMLYELFLQFPRSHLSLWSIKVLTSSCHLRVF